MLFLGKKKKITNTSKPTPKYSDRSVDQMVQKNFSMKSDWLNVFQLEER